MTPRPCHRCGAPGEGAFCTACGAARGERRCPACGAGADPGAGFCANCGTRLTIGDPSPIAKQGRHRPPSWAAPAALGGLALVAVIGAALAGRSPAVATGGGAAPPTAGTPPDISNLTPHERFIRLADRIQSSIQGGDSSGVVQFFPMMEQAYQLLEGDERDIDARFHLALLQAEVGHFDAATAQVDSIEAATSPRHLLASYLRAIIADFQGDLATGKSARTAFREHYDAEVATRRPEYVGHASLLEAFRKAAGPT